MKSYDRGTSYLPVLRDLAIVLTLTKILGYLLFPNTPAPEQNTVRNARVYSTSLEREVSENK